MLPADGDEVVYRAFQHVPGNVVVLDREGDIIWYNRGWSEFGDENGLDPHLLDESVNYLAEWETAPDGDHDEYALRAQAGVHGLLEGLHERFEMEYPCHGPDEKRWFLLQGRGFEHGGRRHVVLAHIDISARRRRELKLHHRATHDLLTGLLEREAFLEHLADELERSERYGHPLSVTMVDLDHFKDVNDTHGHLVGDDVLRELGEVLMEATRDVDRVGRYGGEEFIVLLPETGQDEARRASERIRRSIEEHDFPIPDRGEPLTASVGTATGVGAKIDPEAFIDRADRALYRAKEEGRNRVVSEKKVG